VDPVKVETDHGFDAWIAFARANERFISWSLELGKRPHVKGTRHSADVRLFTTDGRPKLDCTCYAEADFEGDKTVIWGLVVSWDGSIWQIETSISRPHRDGAVALLPPTQRNGSTAGEFAAALGETVEQLMRTEVDLVVREAMKKSQ
jgi:hypothetical protein